MGFAAAGFDWSITGYFDDGALVFVNGIEVARINMPTTGTIVDSTRPLVPRKALTTLAASVKTIPAGVVVEGLNVLAVQVRAARRNDGVRVCMCVCVRVDG
jgi:hypothetical protein